MSLLSVPALGNRARYDITVVSPDGSTSGQETKRISRKGYSSVKNIGTKVGAALIALLIAGLMLLGNISAAPSAHAGDWGPMNGFRDVMCGTAYFNAKPDDRGLGANTADPKLMNTATTKLTAYEKYGMAGMTWTVWLGAENHGQITGDGDVAGKQIAAMAGGANLDNWATGDAKADSSFYNTTSECAPIGDTGPTAVGNFLLSVTSWIVNISNLLFQTATETSSSVLQTLTPTIIAIVDHLKDALYLEFLAPVLMMGALYLGWKGLVKRSSTEAGSAAIWMLGATVAGFAVLANPMFLPSVVNTVVSTVSETTIAAITQVALAGNHTSGVTSSNATLCTLDGNNGKTQTADSTGKVTVVDFNKSQNAARTSVRQIQCTMWYSFMYTPWVIGQFGVSPSATDTSALTDGYPNKTGSTNPISPVPSVIPLGNGSTPGNWAIYQLDSKVNYPGSDKKAQGQGMLNVAASQMYKPNANGTWKGTSSMNRVTTATLAMISALGAGAMIAVISMSMIVLQIGLVILTLFSAMFLLIGVHPGFGRRIALGWLESMAGLAMKRIVLSVLLAVMLVFYSAVLSASASIDWLISMIMVIAVSIGGISYKDQLTTMFSRISLGGNGGLSEQALGGPLLQRMGMNAGKKAAGLAAGAATGGASMAMAGAAAGAGARKNNKAVRESVMNKIAEEDEVSAGAGDRPKSDGPAGDSSTDEGTAAGAGERPASSANTDSNEAPVSDNIGGAGERPTGSGSAETIEDESTGAGGRPAQTQETPAEPQTETYRRVSDAEQEMLAEQKKARIKQALSEAPMVNTRKAVFEAVKGARKQRNVVGGYKTGSATAKRHIAKAHAVHQNRIKQQERAAEFAARNAENVETTRINQEAKRKKAEANKAAADLRKQQAEDAKSAYEQAKNKPGTGKHRNPGLPALN